MGKQRGVDKNFTLQPWRGGFSSSQLKDLFSEVQPLGIAPTISNVAGFGFPACISFSICIMHEVQASNYKLKFSSLTL